MAERPTRLDRAAISLESFLLMCVLAVVFVQASHQRLYHSDLWAHLAYARWIIEHETLPDHEIFMPLARDVPMRATAWRSQILALAAYRTGGHHGLQVLYASGLVGCVGGLMLAAGRGRGRAAKGVAATGVFLLAAREHLVIIRPQLAGVLCFCLLLALLVRVRRFGMRESVLVATIFVAWVNLHPSFPAGLLLLAGTTFGHAIDTAVATGSLRRAALNRRVRGTLLLSGVAGMATLLNPWGWRIYQEVLHVSGHPNLRDLLDWQPLAFSMRQARVTAIFVTVALLCLTTTRRDVRWSGLVPLLVAGAGTLLRSRMIVWFAPLLGLFIATHGFDRLPRWSSSPSLSRRWTLATVLVVLVSLLASALPRAVVSTLERPLIAAVSGSTPVNAAPPVIRQAGRGLIYAPNTWGDYLVWQSDARANVMTTSHAHLVPRSVWQDYRRIGKGGPEALRLLDEYEVTVVLADKRRPAIIRAVNGSPTWSVFYEGSRAIAFRRAGSENPQR